jgi:hypothetical protein
LGHAATLRFPSPLIEPDVPISGIRLSNWLHREAPRPMAARPGDWLGCVQTKTDRE